jgi:hypothetical protein
MTQAPSANWEITIVLPLGVMDSRLRGIEEQLRLLNMKALDFGKESENGTLRRLIEAKLERIREVLGSIDGLVSDIDADIQPAGANPALTPRAEDTSVDNMGQSRDGVRSDYALRKAYPDQDD